MNIKPEDCTKEELLCYAIEGCQCDDWEFQRIILSYRRRQAGESRKREHLAASEALRRCQRLIRPFSGPGADIPRETFEEAMRARQIYHRHAQEEIRYQQMEEAYRAELEALYDWR